MMNKALDIRTGTVAARYTNSHYYMQAAKRLLLDEKAEDTRKAGLR